MVSGRPRLTRAQQVAGHMRAGRDYEQAGNLGSARRHYLCALQRATRAERPGIEEALERVTKRSARPPARAVLEMLEGLSRRRPGRSR
jgi:hypothetical protein